MKLIVNPHKIELEKTPVNEKEIDITICQFEFSDEITEDYVKEAYFTLKGNTYKQIIVNNQCSIPYEVLTTSGTVEIGVVAYLVENEEEIKRYNPSPAYFDTWVGSLKDDAENSEPITPSEMEQYEQALQDGLSEVNGKIEDINTAITQTNNLNLDANKVGNTTTVTITKKDGTTKQVQVLDGNTGPAGRDGVDGTNGITPTIGDNGNWYLGDTDTGKPSRGIQGETGQTGATGPAGRDGTNGTDGVSPIATISKSGDTATITITDKNGTTTATVKDGTNGTNGTNGRDGYMQYTAGDNITIQNNVISATGGTNLPVYVIKANVNNGFFATQNVLSPKTTEFTDILNDIAKNRYSSIIVNVYAPGSSIQTGCYGMIFQATDITLSESGGTISLSGVFFNQRSFSTYLQATFHKVSVSYSYSNNLYTCTSISENASTINCADFNLVLSKTNTTSYTPTSDYHPATKKYVDDAISTAITSALGGNY